RRRPAEEVDFARPGARDDVLAAVAVEVHQLGTEADASGRGDAAVLFPGLELDAGGVARGGVAADVLVDPQDAVAELADEQVQLAVAVDVRQVRGGVADGRVNRLAVRFEPDRRPQFGRQTGGRLVLAVARAVEGGQGATEQQRGAGQPGE